MIGLKELGANIQMQRKLKGITQVELAEKAGIALQTVRSVETGKSNMTFGMFNRILEALEVNATFRLKRR